MSEDKTKNNSKNMSLDDAALWQNVTADVKLMPGKAYIEGSGQPESVAEPLMGASETIVPAKAAASRKKPQGTDLDRRTEDRLRKGQMEIEGRLDLHNMTQQQAYEALNRFISFSYERGRRCVLVITGKGKNSGESKDWLSPEPGVLKRRVPEWLFEASLGGCVLKAVPAQQKDGGEGALYVYLRRNR